MIISSQALSSGVEKLRNLTPKMPFTSSRKASVEPDSIQTNKNSEAKSHVSYMSDQAQKQLNDLNEEHQALRKKFGGRTMRLLKTFVSSSGSARSAQTRIKEIKQQKNVLQAKANLQQKNEYSHQNDLQAKANLQQKYEYSHLSYPFHLKNKNIRDIGNQVLKDNILTHKDLKDMIYVDDKNRVHNEIGQKYGDTGFLLKNDNGRLVHINPMGNPPDPKATDRFKDFSNETIGAGIYSDINQEDITALKELRILKEKTLTHKDLNDMIYVDDQKRVYNQIGEEYGKTGFILKNDNGSLVHINPMGNPPDPKATDSFKDYSNEAIGARIYSDITQDDITALKQLRTKRKMASVMEM